MSTRARFAVDAMLGNLAKKLRILGYDSKYDSSIEDAKLITIAKKENRILVTKDEALTKNAEKENIPTVLIRGNDEIEQIVQITNKVGLPNFTVSTDNARCVSCNGKLEPIEKMRIKSKVPYGIYERQESFWICKGCKKVYWEGTHLEKLRKFVNDLNQRIS